MENIINSRHIVCKKCIKHPLMLCDLISISPQTEQHRVCLLCIREQEIPYSQLMSIGSILQFDPSQPLPFYSQETQQLQCSVEQIQLAIQSLVSESDDALHQLILSFTKSNNEAQIKSAKSYLDSVECTKKWDENQLKCQSSSQFNNSTNDLSISSANNTIVIKNQADSGYWARQCYLTTIFDPQQSYIIRLQINNSFNDFPDFAFGLINSQDKDSFLMADSDGIYYREFNGGTTTTILKGEQVHAGWKNKQIGQKILEFQICIATKLWNVSSEFRNVIINTVQLNDSNKIDSNKKYHFGIVIYNPQDSVTILEVQEVSELKEQQVPLTNTQNLTQNIGPSNKSDDKDIEAPVGQSSNKAKPKGKGKGKKR